LTGIDPLVSLVMVELPYIGRSHDPPLSNEATDAEEYLFRVPRAMEAFPPQLIVVDALSSSLRMGSEQAAFDYALRLLTACKERGITCLWIRQCCCASSNATARSTAYCWSGRRAAWPTRPTAMSSASPTMASRCWACMTATAASRRAKPARPPALVMFTPWGSLHVPPHASHMSILESHFGWASAGGVLCASRIRTTSWRSRALTPDVSAPVRGRTCRRCGRKMLRTGRLWKGGWREAASQLRVVGGDGGIANLSDPVWPLPSSP
jgi:hypothetical protein